MVEAISPALQEFLTERHLAVLVTQRPDGSPHAVPVGFTFHDGVVRVITRAGSAKVRHARAGGRASVTQVDGGRWVTLEGHAAVIDDPAGVAAAVAAYAARYRQPAERDDRVAITITVDRMLMPRSLK